MKTTGISLGLGAALLAVIALHLFEPDLSITWSYSHLSRDSWRVLAAVLLTVALPGIGAWAWTRPASMRPLDEHSGAVLAVVGLSVVAVVAVLGQLAPAPASNYDSIVLLDTMRGTRDGPMRWMLGTATLETLFSFLARGRDPTAFLAAANSAFAAVGILGLIAAGREVAQTRGEAIGLAVLVASAFGTLQITLGYLEIYPLALGILGSYIGLAARTLYRETSLVGCAVIAALAPFFYIGLALLAPSTIVLAVVIARRPGGLRRVGIAAAAGLAVAGLATLPHYGTPFAWSAFVADASADSHAQIGLQAGSPLLPLQYILSAKHLNEVFHSLLLVDPVGWLLLLGPGVALLSRSGTRTVSPFAAFLAAIATPYLVYAFWMDPLFGAYQDWDLWVTGAPAVSLLAAWAFIVWGRDQPRVTGALLGLALACASVHALARLHAIPIDAERHLRESPFHVSQERERERPQASRRPTHPSDA